MTPSPCVGWISDLLLSSLYMYTTTAEQPRQPNNTREAGPFSYPFPSPFLFLPYMCGSSAISTLCHALDSSRSAKNAVLRVRFGLVRSSVCVWKGRATQSGRSTVRTYMPTHTEEGVRDPPASNRSPTLVPAGAAASASPSPRVRCRRRAAETAVADGAVVCRSGSGIRK